LISATEAACPFSEPLTANSPNDYAASVAGIDAQELSARFFNIIWQLSG
jgi:hypothetical protein